MRKRTGSIQQRGEDTWFIRVSTGSDGGGRRVLTRTVHGTEAQAEAEKHRLLAEFHEGDHSFRPGTFGELAERWYEAFGQHLAKPQDYRNNLDHRLLPELGKMSLTRITPAFLDQLYGRVQRQRDIKAATVRRKWHTQIHAILEQGVKWGEIRSNPASLATPPEAEKPDILPPSTKEVEKLLASGTPEFRCYLRLAAITGARPNELCRLRWRDVDLANTQVRITWTKTGKKSRYIALDSGTAAVLKQHQKNMAERSLVVGRPLAPDGYVFSGDPASRFPRHPSTMTHWFAKARDDLGLSGIRLYDLRHYVATQLLGAGEDPVTVAGRLGNSPYIVLTTYAAFIPARDRNAANKMGGILDASATRSRRRGKQPLKSDLGDKLPVAEA